MNHVTEGLTPESRGKRLSNSALGVLQYICEVVACGVVGWFGTLVGAGAIMLLSTAVAMVACAVVSITSIAALIALLIRRGHIAGFTLGITVGVTLASAFVIFVLIPFTESMSDF
ncbi:hypothetical protein [Gordonia effusa]|uniref:hypothetical protein n=1 Tax=Gordonia effusa TaxID=263908 RepID=UPI00030621C9|nr:hypothetical protein [Gordonia effusa]